MANPYNFIIYLTVIKFLICYCFTFSFICTSWKTHNLVNFRKKRKTSEDSGQGEADKWLASSLQSRSGIRVEDRVSCHNAIIRSQEEEVERLQEQIFSGVFDNIVTFVRESSGSVSRDTIPTAVLLTGVNMPDHNKVRRLVNPQS